MMGRLTPRAPCSALTTISFFLFFPVLFLFFCSFFFFDSRGGLCRKGGTALNVSQPRLLWSGHATHPIHSVVWRDQVNVTPERAQVLFQFSLWQSDWRNQRKVWRKNIHKKKMSRVSRVSLSWCSFSLIFNQFWFKKRGKNGGVRSQVIRRTKVKKFKKIDGDDFFPIVRWSPSPSTCGEDQLGDNFTKEENDFSKKQKKKRARFKRNKVTPGEDKYDLSMPSLKAPRKACFPARGKIWHEPGGDFPGIWAPHQCQALCRLLAGSQWSRPKCYIA